MIENIFLYLMPLNRLNTSTLNPEHSFQQTERVIIR